MSENLRAAEEKFRLPAVNPACLFHAWALACWSTSPRPQAPPDALQGGLMTSIKTAAVKPSSAGHVCSDGISRACYCTSAETERGALSHWTAHRGGAAANKQQLMDDAGVFVGQTSFLAEQSKSGASFSPLSCSSFRGISAFLLLFFYSYFEHESV